MRCRRCGFENPARFKFCGECGAPLAAVAAPAAGTQVKNGQGGEEAWLHEAERRQLTVMFCDLVGSTRLAAQLDPEELRNLVRRYQEVCAQVVGRYEGHIAQYLGDGVLVYFGYPFAHEDDAYRAVCSGLQVVEGINRLNTRLQLEAGVCLQVRVGIHTGRVVVGEVGGGERREQLALGETPNVAARLQALAEPNSVVISAATHRLIQGFFECEPRGARLLKGMSRPLQLYRVLRESGALSRLEIAGASDLTTLVGKDQELKQLLDAWRSVQHGSGRAIVLSGEAGIGKSRLAQTLKHRIAPDPHLLLETRCSPYHQNSAFHPFIHLLERQLSFKRDQSEEEKRAHLEELSRKYLPARKEALPLFSGLLSISAGERPHVAPHGPEREKQKILLALRDLLLAMAQQQPVLFLMEDLHWSDPSTLEALNLMMEAGAEARLFLVLTTRPVFHASWPSRPHVQQMTLNRLTHAQVEAMIREVTGGRTLPEEVLWQLKIKTDGVPLFVEELTKMVLESGILVEQEDRFELSGPLPPLAIPTTLQDSLMARLDRLAAVKEVAQLAATVGREFSHELLAAIWPHDEATLERELERLVKAELIYRQANEAQVTYTFKHALIQDAAYESLLKSKRQQYHQRIAQVLTEKFLDVVNSQPEILAHHYTEAGLIETAVVYWQWAGERALTQSAHTEALSHLNRGLELLHNLPATPQRLRQELELLTARGVTLIATKGYAAGEVEQNFQRAWEVCEQSGDTTQLPPVVLGLWECALLRADLHRSHALARQFMALAEKSGDTALYLSAHLILGISLFHLGQFEPAHEHLRRGAELYDPAQHAVDAFVYGQDPGVTLLSYLAIVLWMLGYPDQALDRAHAALRLAEQLGHPFTRALALNFTADLFDMCGEVALAAACAHELKDLATEHGFRFWLAGAWVLEGRALLRQGKTAAGLALIHQGVERFRETGTQLGKQEAFARLAEVYVQTGHVETGLALLDEAEKVMASTSEHCHESEFHRLRGEVLQMVSAQNSAEVETCFQTALLAARQRTAKSLELRAAMSLSRLWLRQGRRAAARQQLEEIFGWFREGFGTEDLRQARALLDSLA